MTCVIWIRQPLLAVLQLCAGCISFFNTLNIEHAQLTFFVSVIHPCKPAHFSGFSVLMFLEDCVISYLKLV